LKDAGVGKAGSIGEGAQSGKGNRETWESSANISAQAGSDEQKER
jgi:hypothetical protein